MQVPALPHKYMANKCSGSMIFQIYSDFRIFTNTWKGLKMILKMLYLQHILDDFAIFSDFQEKVHVSISLNIPLHIHA